MDMEGKRLQFQLLCFVKFVVMVITIAQSIVIPAVAALLLRSLTQVDAL
jgi:hypothetical protein